MFSFFSNNGQEDNAFTIAFYNVENLFDTINNPNTQDGDFTPLGSKHWNKKRYNRKIKKLSKVISQIGKKKSKYLPVLIGLVEVENRTVIEDLLKTSSLQKENYGIVHYNSPDTRGIDVALLYKKDFFEIESSTTFPLYLENEKGEREYTRDVLVVHGYLNKEPIYILVNHWPSRNEGVKESEIKRIKAAELVTEISNTIRNSNPNAKIIVMGDFNDNPTDKSIRLLVNNTFYNPMERLYNLGNGSLKHNKEWYLFDQIIFSKSFLEPLPNTHSFKYAEVFDAHFLKVFKGKKKGSPFRTFIGKWYQGGISDHFPVYVYLNLN